MSVGKMQYTWDIFSYPPTVKPIGSKWVFSVKLRSNGFLDWNKACLVALGNKQEYRVDYEETFAHVAKITIVRIILATFHSNDNLLQCRGRTN